MGDRAAYAELVREVRASGADPLARGALAGALVEAAEGASLLHSRTLAGELLDEALHLARERVEVDVLARVEELRVRISTAAADEVPAPAPGEGADDLARELVSCLQSGGASDAAATAVLPAGE